MSVWMWLLLLNAGVWLGAPLTYSAEASLPKERANEAVSTRITSKTMTVNNHENKAVFEGSVVLTRGPLIVHSDHMVIHFHPSGDPGDGKSLAATEKVKSGLQQAKREPTGKDAMPAVSGRTIRMIEATGHVQIEKDEGRANCQKAVYYDTEKKLVCTGDPVAWQKGTRVSGKRITMFLDEDRSLVEGDSQVTIEGEGGGKP